MRTNIRWLLGLCLCGHIMAFAAEPPQKKQNPPSQAKPKPTVIASQKTTAIKPTSTAATAAAAPAAAVMQPSELASGEQRVVVAEQVHTGRMACELGNFVTVTVDPQNAGAFVVQIKQHKFHMVPVVSSTGAVRLEDAQAGAMWLQLANKSMLMNSKLGQRMADECQSPQQATVAEAMKLAPPPSLLEGPAVAKK